MAKKNEQAVSEDEWQALVCGVVVKLVGDEKSVALYAKRVHRCDAVRLVQLAWERKRLWPHCPYVASCDFSVHECEDEPGMYDVALWAAS